MTILGVTGTLGAGKGTVVEYLVTNKGFRHYSASGFIKEEIVRRGLHIDRDSMSATANELRALHGPAFIIASLLERAKEHGGDALIEALHAVAEEQEIHKAGGIVIAVDADIKIRYERISKRMSEKDNVSFEKFVEQNEREIASMDPAKHNIASIMNNADFILENNGTLEELHKRIDALVGKIEN